MFDEFDLPENVKKVLMDKVRHRLMPNPVKIRAGAPEFNNPPPLCLCLGMCLRFCVYVCRYAHLFCPPPKKKIPLNNNTPA